MRSASASTREAASGQDIGNPSERNAPRRAGAMREAGEDGEDGEDGEAAREPLIIRRGARRCSVRAC
ncbi:hypothetical protein WI94_10790 [Burkholderia vietnamiensis]|nr:hypothetical protein WI94_10790 [Burkholderia vietnamiensis]